MQRLHKITLAAAALALSVSAADGKTRAITTDQNSVALNGNQQLSEPAGSHVMAMYIWSRTYALFDTSEGVSTPPSDEDRVILFDNSVNPSVQTTLFCNPADGAAGNCTTSKFGDTQDLGTASGNPMLLALVADDPLDDFVVGQPIILGSASDVSWGGFLDWIPKTGGYATFQFDQQQPAPGATGLPPPTTADVMAKLAQYPGGSNAKFIGFQDWFYQHDTVVEYQYDAAVIAVWTVAGVPEPGAWAILLVGFFGVGSVIRKRQLSALA